LVQLRYIFTFYFSGILRKHSYFETPKSFPSIKENTGDYIIIFILKIFNFIKSFILYFLVKSPVSFGKLLDDEELEHSYKRKINTPSTSIENLNVKTFDSINDKSMYLYLVPVLKYRLN